MPRKLLVRDQVLPYHVTARANNREDFAVAPEQLWELIGIEGQYLTSVFEAEIQALVLMPNHFHMIITVPRHDLGIVMNHFMKSIAQRSNLILGRSGHVFGGPYHWSLISNTRYFGHALKYVYRNPVRAKICANVEDYPYSTLRGLLGYEHLAFPIHFSRVGMEVSLPYSNTQQLLEWLNSPFPVETEPLIKKGLRKKVFEIIMDRKTLQPPDPFNN